MGPPRYLHIIINSIIENITCVDYVKIKKKHAQESTIIFIVHPYI